MLIDTHTHLYLPDMAGDGAVMVRRALAAGVGHMIFPNVDYATISPQKDLHSEFPDVTSMAMGLHPTEVRDDYISALGLMERELYGNVAEKYVAVGEIGIDLYWDDSFRKQQIDALLTQCRWAIDLNLPVIIHCRNGLGAVLDVMERIDLSRFRAVFHSFGGTDADVDLIRSYGDFYFGINGIVTFKNSKLRDVLPHIGIDRILFETDSPYLAPVPYRGKRNESSYLPAIAAYVAESMSVSLEYVEDVTTRNAISLFALSLPVREPKEVLA